MQYYFLLASFILLASCSNQADEIDAVLAHEVQTEVERGKNIRIIYSDSAQVRMIIHAPVMERYNVINNSRDVFPKGILLEFLDDDKKVKSNLKADSAVREERNGKVTAKGNVVFINESNGQKLETPELIWDEKERIVYTEKVVRITQAEKGDTTYGFGFKANQELTRFEIKKKVQGKLNVSDFVTGFD